MEDKDKKFHVNVSDLYTTICDVVDGEMQIKIVPLLGKWYLWMTKL